MSRPRPGAALGRVLAALAVAPVVLLSGAPAALATGEEPAVVPTVLPGPEEPSEAPPPEPEPEPSTEEPAPEPEPTRTVTRAPAPVVTVAPVVEDPLPLETLPEATTEPPTAVPTSTATTTRAPLPVGELGDDAEATPDPEPADDGGDPADRLTRLVQLVIGGAVLLGVGGGVGLYLTREGR